MDLEKIEKLIQLMDKYQLGEVSYRSGDDKIHLVQNPKGFQQALVMQSHAMNSMMLGQTPAAAPSPNPALSGSNESQAAASKKKFREVKSPFVGTFYGAPSPGADPFVQVGTKVKKGDTLCIVEAMKLMNEIEAEVDGVIVEILVDNESPIEFNQLLFLIE